MEKLSQLVANISQLKGIKKLILLLEHTGELCVIVLEIKKKSHTELIEPKVRQKNTHRQHMPTHTKVEKSST